MTKKSTNAREWPILLKTKMENWMFETFQGLNWYVQDLRQNTDEMRKEIKQLKEKMNSQK